MTNDNKAVVKMICMFAAMVIVLTACTVFGTRYTREGCKVVNVIGNDVYVVDTCGNRWSFEGKGYKVGQLVDLRMDNAGTDNTIKDDRVVRALN